MKKGKIKSVLIFLNIIVVILYLFACLVPFLNAGQFWIIAILGLGFPFLLVFLLVFLFLWAIKRSKWVFLCLAALLISIQQLSVTFAFHLKKEFVIDKPESTLRVLSWNVSRWDERNKEKRGGVSFRRLMMDFIQIQGADVLCLQEFFECHDPHYYEANIPAIEKMGYPYHYFFPSSALFDGKFQYGMAIFSKYPIIDSAEFPIEISTHSEGLSYVDIKTSSQTLRIFSIHLESVGFNSKDYENLGEIQGSRGILGKIRRSYQLRSRQAEMASEIIKASPYPVIVCGDLDDIPNSYVYFKIKGRLQDAFIKKGSGLGKTFRFISPTLRIDYILAHRKFTIKQYTRIEVPYSDHYPIVADLHYNP
ncbi:MAG: endonuclease/exonuclease/phosphatase family protein [Chitinophagaceae bacterium]